MAEFSGVDFLQLDALLSDEERIARDTVREFVSKEFLPLVQEHVRRDGSFPMGLVPRMAELGLFGANLTGYGCAGMSNVAYGLVMQELERGDSGLRSFASVQGALVMFPIHSYGSDAQKERYFPRLASDTVGAYALSEAGAGSDAFALTTRAVRDGGEFALASPSSLVAFAHRAHVQDRTHPRDRGGVPGPATHRVAPGLLR